MAGPLGFFGGRSKSPANRTRAIVACLQFLITAGICCLPHLVLGAGARERAAGPSPAKIGAFEGQTDVGDCARAGSAEFDAANSKYVVSGGGANMWAEADAFHFVWRRMSGDLTLTATPRFAAQGGNEHRKAGLIIRQSLEPGAPYVDLVIHGNGLTSMQYRETPGAATKEIQSDFTSPTTIRLVRQGGKFFMFVAAEGEGLLPSGEPLALALRDPVYVGLAVCAHDNNVLEKAVFPFVGIENVARLEQKRPIESCLETISIETGERRVVYRSPRLFEAPNWSADGKTLLFNGDGKIQTIPVTGGEPKVLDTGTCDRCNNDHGLSPDGKWLAISHAPKGPSLIYVVPSAGGEPRLVTPKGPSYWHGWSPDGKTLTYCAERNGNYDVYTIPAAGGEEQRLTDAEGLDDGPEYTPDGKYIYFNSERGGLMQIWRMKADGSAPEQVTNDGYADWFPHPSPDGRWLVFLSYNKLVKGHPADKQVVLRIMPPAGGTPRILARFTGGQGTINVPSWSPDGKFVAFVSYRPMP